MQSNESQVEVGYVGTPGRRMTLTLKCISKLPMPEGQYGPKTLVKFEDAAGNYFVWFGSGSVDWLTEDETFEVKATIKKHQPYNGRKQNLLERVTLSGVVQERKPRPEPKAGEHDDTPF